MCPKCGEFIEASEDSHVIICHKCGTLHTLSPDSNKDLYSKNIHNCTKQPDYPPRYTLKSIYRFFDGKTGATAFYKLHLAQRKVFQTACRVMNRGLYAQALDFFAIIPNFDGVSAKVQECRKHINEAKPAQKHEAPVKSNTPKRKGDFAVILGVFLQGLVMWIIFKVLEALLS